jgi:signal transduction histidine kinase
MLRLPSLFSRILFLHIAALIATAIVMPLMLYWLFNADVERLQQLALRQQAEAVAGHLRYAQNSGLTLTLPPSLKDQYSSAYGRYSYAIVDEQGRTLFSSRGDGKTIYPIAIGPSAPDADYFETSRGDRIISGASLRTIVGGFPVHIQVGEDLAHRDVLIDDVVDNFFAKVGWVTFPILLLLLASDFLIFRRAIRPLLVASDQAAHISPTRIDVRLPTQDIPNEIRPLVVAVNQALDRLATGFRQQREFTADAAHELRTPLAVLRTRIETWPDRTVSDALLQDVESMSRVISQLLDAAELETAVVDPDDVADIRQVCLEVIEFIAPIALAQNKSVALSGDEMPVLVRGNPEMLQRAMINLVENALKYTAVGTDVEVVVLSSGTIHVLDEGAGIPQASRKEIFERFWRRDRRRTTGAGLGLSIVKRIVESHGGTIAVDNRPTGGAVFSIQFELVQSNARGRPH